MEKLNVVSFSGGKDSTAMLLMMVEKGIKIDLILWCDTGLEFPAMYEHVNKVEKYVGIPITRLKADKSFEYWFLEHKPKRRNPALQGMKGKSWATAQVRWCTKELKTNVIQRFLKELYKKYDVQEFIGIAADEPKRIKDKHYPLVDWKMTEQDCLDFCYSKGFDFGGLYEIFHRVSCWCCPLQSLDELRNLQMFFPDLWMQLKEWDSKTWRTFRADYSVAELEVRFELEKQRIAEGKSVSNREFYKELKELLGKVVRS